MIRIILFLFLVAVIFLFATSFAEEGTFPVADESHGVIIEESTPSPSPSPYFDADEADIDDTIDIVPTVAIVTSSIILAVLFLLAFIIGYRKHSDTEVRFWQRYRQRGE